MPKHAAQPGRRIGASSHPSAPPREIGGPTRSSTSARAASSSIPVSSGTIPSAALATRVRDGARRARRPRPRGTRTTGWRWLARSVPGRRSSVPLRPRKHATTGLAPAHRRPPPPRRRRRPRPRHERRDEDRRAPRRSRRRRAPCAAPARSTAPTRTPTRSTGCGPRRRPTTNERSVGLGRLATARGPRARPPRRRPRPGSPGRRRCRRSPPAGRGEAAGGPARSRCRTAARACRPG